MNFDLQELTGVEKQQYVSKMLHIKSALKRGVIPVRYPELISDWRIPLIRDTNNELDRFEYISFSAFPLISYSWIKPLAEFIGNKKCIEVMAGSGMFSEALSRKGVDIISTSDNYTWHRPWKKQWRENIEELNAIDAINRYGLHVDYVLCSWPNYDEDTAYQILLRMHEVNPNLTMIYIGEDHGGCTADDKFFENSEYIHDEKFAEVKKNFQSWAGVHDSIELVKIYKGGNRI